MGEHDETNRRHVVGHRRVVRYASGAAKRAEHALKWNPNEKQSVSPLDTTGGIYSLTVTPVVDKRDTSKPIGENTEGKVPVPVYTDSDVADYVGDHAAAQFKAIGVG